MQTTPKNFRIHIGLFGRRNVGKSSILNALTQQQVSIVSPVAGTTTDPVEKPMELLPLGPVLFIDTAGLDDEGAIGQLRISKTKQVFDRCDLALIITSGEQWGTFENSLAQEFKNRSVPCIAVFNKSDLESINESICAQLKKEQIPTVETSTLTGNGIAELRIKMLSVIPDDLIMRPAIVADLVKPGQYAVLVVPIDKEAPKGRLILPQVQCIRDLLDNDSHCIVTKERELRHALSTMSIKPALVVTDSQAFLKVAADTPDSVPLTSFSILFARYHADLSEMVYGAVCIDSLKPMDRICIAEACSHHPIGEDIGSVKIPRWLNQYIGGKLTIDHVRGHDFPDDISGYKLIIHCGACMWNRREMLNRILKCRKANVPITNYGLTIAYSLGIFERALQPFPAALQLYQSMMQQRNI